MSRTQTVLVIDDDEMIHKLVPVRLKGLGAEVIGALSGEAGLRMARQRRPDLVLLDVGMPDMDGFEACRRLREDPLTHDIPVIFLTGSDDPREKIRGFDIGATDYITKPFDAAELRARVRGALRTQALLDALETQARTDSLTGLPNRAAFHEAVARCIERARRGPGYRFAVLFLDLDHFKIINDSLGHDIGDELLTAIADELRRCVRTAERAAREGTEDIVARMGGDEFTILLDDAGLEAAVSLADRLGAVLNRPHVLRGYQVKAGVSIGIKVCDADCESADAILRDSDTAMYSAKAAGKGQHAIFNARMHEEAVRRLTLENDLRRAVEEGQFELLYQPIVSLDSGDVLGFEALVRWNRPGTDGVVAPGDFIPIAEETGLILDIGHWVLREACSQLREWNRGAGAGRRLIVSVNLSKVQLEKPGLVEDIAAVLKETGVDPGALKLEVTESVIMHAVETIVPVLGRLREMGTRIAIDDFGTGYSSLASLHRFPIDVVKIDKAFIDNIGRSRTYAAIVHAIATLAHNLDMQVIAEGIEEHEQLVQLQALECDHGQGYFFGKPATAAEVEKRLLPSGAFVRCA